MHAHPYCHPCYKAPSKGSIIFAVKDNVTNCSALVGVLSVCVVKEIEAYMSKDQFTHLH